jgi:hypothetical protein
MLDPACQTKRAPLADRGDDLYETPPVAVRALLAVESLPDTVWEPACGPGVIVGVLRDSGHRVYATDLVDHGCRGQRTRSGRLSRSEQPQPQPTNL